MSVLSQQFDDFGFDQIADHAGDLFDYHPTGGVELPEIVGIVELRTNSNEVDLARYDNAVEVLHVAFKNDATVGIESPTRGDYITDAGLDVQYFFNSIMSENGTFRTMVWVRHAEGRSGYRVGEERQYR